MVIRLSDLRFLLCSLIFVSCASSARGEAPQFEALSRDFEKSVRPFLEAYCLNCHGKTAQEAKLDLSPFEDIKTVQADLGHWALVLERLKAGEMPPEDADQLPSKEKREEIVKWIEGLRTFEAHKTAGDPGPVLARRLNNTEYDYTIRDLTGVDIRPTREFPVDPANQAGFANSGESLAMSPALFNKYIDAARRVADHLVLMPGGFDFAPHPAVIYSDRDKFAVRRIVDFYLAQKIDYAEFLLAAWLYKHRGALGHSGWKLEDAAKERGVSPKYLRALWELLHDGKNHHGPIAELRGQWESLPVPENEFASLPLDQCLGIRDWILENRKARQFKFPRVMIEHLNPSTQPGILWKNRLIAEHRRKANLTEKEKKDPELKAAIERFCSLFPDRFMVTERGRMNLPPDQQDKGRLLGAGFHLQVGYYRDDAPLYDMVLSDEEKNRLDEMWRELYFVTDSLVRQFQDYVYFERAEGGEIITEAEFDFARGEDRNVASPKSMEKFAKLYVEAVKKRGLEEQAIAEIARYFVEMSKQIQIYETMKADAEPVHLNALLKFAGHAWRRPLSENERQDLREFYHQLRKDSGLSHEDAIRDVVVSILVSPYFCYRVDTAEQNGDEMRLTSYSLANRLSYFLWSSMPDEELRKLAELELLQKPDVLKRQVRRMLLDDRSKALAIEFAGNWLDYRQFRDHVGVDRTKFPEFTDDLRESMFQEPVRFVHDLIRKDGSVQEFLNARHTFIDKNLAKHYQIPFDEDAADADGWLRVDDARKYGRGGLLPMAVFLTRTSPGLRTSPVKRGYWVVKNLLGERIPAPPPDVPELPADESNLGELTLREVLEKHREIPSCAVCHVKFDFAGLVFEGYGPIGQRRTKDLGGKAIDDATLFPDGTMGQGLSGLETYLTKHRREQFEDNLCRKLLAYGLGRTQLLSDEPTIVRMKDALKTQNGRFDSLVEVIVTSPQFLNKRPVEPKD